MKIDLDETQRETPAGGNLLDDSVLLDVKGVVSGYGGKKVLQGVSCKVKKEEIVSVIGPNGAGKSTLLLSILGYLKIDAGEILFKGRSISGTETHEIIKLGIAFCPQGRTIFPDMTVREHLDMGAWTVKNSDQKKETRERAYELYPILKERGKQKAKTLSGGERQMLSLGMAMMTRPNLVLLDEPSLGLAPVVVELVFQNISKVNKEGVSILIVEQNAAKVLEYSHRTYVLDMGKNRYEGQARELLRNENVRQLYLGLGDSSA